MEEHVLKQLNEPFQLRERRGVGNKTFKYVETSDIIERMNKAFKGEWSTETRSVDVVEDSVLICVRVYVPSEVKGELLWQDGYASHPLVRHTGGSNQGKLVDIGNSYKSAMSKAIKTAVSKWGIALNLDEEEHEGSPFNFTTSPSPMPSMSSAPIMDIPNNPFTLPDAVPQMPATTSLPPVVKKDPVVTSDIPMGFPGIGGVNNAPKKAPDKDDFPRLGGGASFTTTSNPIPTFMPENAGTPAELDVDSIPAGGVVLATSVQKVAVEQAMSRSNLTYEQLWEQVMGIGSPIVRLENITYLDAVKLIQHGNNLYKLKSGGPF